MSDSQQTGFFTRFWFTGSFSLDVYKSFYLDIAQLHMPIQINPFAG